jgi:hypothetical protein
MLPRSEGFSSPSYLYFLVSLHKFKPYNCTPKLMEIIDVMQFRIMMAEEFFHCPDLDWRLQSAFRSERTLSCWWVFLYISKYFIFYTYCIDLRSRDSPVGIVTGYGLDDRGVGVRVPVGSRIFSSPQRSDRLWGPPSLLSNGYRGPFSQG